MKKVLLLSYYWPPAGGPGVQRWLKNIVFLDRLGWDITVVCPREPVASNYDESLVNEIPKSVRVIKTDARDPFKAYAALTGKKGQPSTGGIGLNQPKSKKQQLINYIRANFFIPDARKGWNSFALKAARKALAEGDFKAVISTGPPHSTHLIALKLKQEFGLPWLADFRDPWVNIFYNRLFPRTSRTVKKDQALENRVLKEADRILTVSPGLQQEFSDRAQKVELLYNGYDPKDLPEPQTGPQAFFQLSYTGNLKPNQNPIALWECIAEKIEEDSVFARDFRLQFVGNVDPGVQSQLDDLKLTAHCVFEGYQPHVRATEAMVEAGALLFIVPETKDNHLILTGKLFEYLGSGSPLFSIGPPRGNAATIISGAERGATIDYHDKNAMKLRLAELYQAWQVNKRSPRLSKTSTAAYTREGSAVRLSEILEGL